MEALLTETFLTSLLFGAVTAGVPLLLAGLGEQISEKAGVLNIGIEGMMLFGAYAGFVAAYYTGSFWLGFLVGGLGGMAVALLDGAALHPPRHEPDRHRHRPHPRRRGPDGAAASLPVQPAPIRASMPAPVLAIPLLERDPRDRAGRCSSHHARRLSRAWRGGRRSAGCSAHTYIGLNLEAAGNKPAALDAAGVSVDAHAHRRRAGDRLPRRRRRRLHGQCRRRAVRALHDRRRRLHRHRAGHAGARPPALGAAGRRSCSASAWR